MKIINLSKNTLLADKAGLANTFSKRLIGLLGQRSLEKGEGLILSPSNCIHSFFMRFKIDVIFLDKTDKVLGILPSFKPFRFSPIYFRASLVIELPEFTIASTEMQVGDKITFED